MEGWAELRTQIGSGGQISKFGPEGLSGVLDVTTQCPSNDKSCAKRPGSSPSRDEKSGFLWTKIQVCWVWVRVRNSGMKRRNVLDGKPRRPVKRQTKIGDNFYGRWVSFPSHSLVCAAFLVLFLTFILVNFFFKDVSKRTFFNTYIQTSHFQPFSKLFMFNPAEIVNPENSLFPN